MVRNFNVSEFEKLDRDSIFCLLISYFYGIFNIEKFQELLVLVFLEPAGQLGEDQRIVNSLSSLLGAKLDLNVIYRALLNKIPLHDPIGELWKFFAPLGMLFIEVSWQFNPFKDCLLGLDMLIIKECFTSQKDGWLPILIKLTADKLLCNLLLQCSRETNLVLFLNFSLIFPIRILHLNVIVII